MTATARPSADVYQHLEHIGRRGVANGLQPLIAFICRWLMMPRRVPHGFAGIIPPSTFIRFDSGQYLLIARHGYLLLFHCHGTAADTRLWQNTTLPGLHVGANSPWFA